MGHGGYSHEAHQAITRARASLPREKVFTRSSCHDLMNPYGVKLRESRDSGTHPTSLAIAFALDVTGSMGAIPELLARRELPTFMKSLLDAGVRDPQVLFLAVGDANCDKAPLQVGQFESAAREMDQWLVSTFLEGGGGGQGTESYELGLYFLARHTEADCWSKRRKRGFMFMTGDENIYPEVNRFQVKNLIGDDLAENLPVSKVVSELAERYEPFFLIPDQARRARCERGWRDLLGDHVIAMSEPEDTCHVAAGIISLVEGVVPGLDGLAERLGRAGVPAKRVSSLVKALTPFAATRCQDGAPEPALGDARTGSVRL